MKLLRHHFAFVSVAVLLLTAVTCNRPARTSQRIRRHRHVKVAVNPKQCGTDPQQMCVPCEFAGPQLCVMSLDWLSGLEDISNPHPAVLIHKTDHVFWIGTNGEQQLDIKLDQMKIVDCIHDQPTGKPPVLPFKSVDDDNNLHRIKHAQPNPGAVGLCFKNFIDYQDENGIQQPPVDPHIYIGDS